MNNNIIFDDEIKNYELEIQKIITSSSYFNSLDDLFDDNILYTKEDIVNIILTSKEYKLFCLIKLYSFITNTESIPKFIQLACDKLPDIETMLIKKIKKLIKQYEFTFKIE